ncbi:MAG: error-prone DNA polymerase [Terriglobales bacterium]|jgi:error-prone DNA polymerase
MYVELHSRSAFSFLEGASIPEELIAVCANLGMPAMALLDRDGVYGSPRFHLAAKKVGIKAHIGAEVTCTSFSPRCPPGEFRLPLLVASRAGYQNLCRLITKMKLRVGRKEGACASDSDFIEHADGLICLTGGEEGPLAAALRQGGPQAAFEAVKRLTEIFGHSTVGPGNVYVELQRHFHREEEYRNRLAIEIAEALQLPLLATNGVNYATPRERELADAFTALQHRRTLATAGRLLAPNAERYLKSPAAMRALFADVPQAIANTVELSSRLEFTLNDLGYEFPRYPVPEGETMMSFLRERTREGMQSRYGRADAELKKRARRQIERELNLIEKLKLAGYFLIVWDLVRFCREQKILAQGRGSAANSAVCYSLGITAVDPIGMELLFERFLSEERGEWPDIDLDLPSGDERERVIQYVYQRYGQRGAAMTANVITYRNRMAAREMGKALGFDEDTLKRISAAVATWGFKDENDALDRRLRDAGLDLKHPRMRKYFELCLAAQDLPRHLGQHSGGMVICEGRLDSVVPLEPASMPGRVVVQWDKEDCADMGIIKVDLLGLGMMAALKDSLELIRDHYHAEVDLAHLPPDDPVVYSTLQKADTVGMFQVESRAQMACLPRLKPQRFYDIVVQVAIIRPGPIVGNMVNPFLKRRQGREAVTYPHPSLETVLGRTLGVPLFQEQLLRMAMITANFTGGEAEELRRAMGFKRSEARMKVIEEKLRAGMTRNGICGETQEQIIQSITSFALYGFPESHAASFALIAYASAYLKCHYLAAFTAALLNNQPMGFYHPATIVKDAQRHGLKVLPMDVTRSDWKCSLETVASGQWPVASRSDTLPGFENLAVRLGLKYARGLREPAGQALVRERSLAPFASIQDLARRVPELRKDELTTLAEIGALNSVGSGQWPVASTNQSEEFVVLSTAHCPLSTASFHRRDALWQVERAVRWSGPLLDELPEIDGESPLAAMTHEERLVADFRATGLTVGPHPMQYRRTEMKNMGIFRACDLAHLPNGRRLRIGGCVIARQRPGTAKGMMFMSLEDETGIANAIIAPDLLQKNRALLISERFLMIEGILQNQDNVIHIRAEKVSPLCVTRAETVSHDFH